MNNKKYPQFTAKPAREAIDEIVPMLDKMLNAKIFGKDPEGDNVAFFDVGPIEGREELAEKLKKLVNPDVCLTQPQQDAVTLNMLDYLNDPNRAQMMAMVTFINSFRGKCARCTNVSCEQRDINDV